MNRHAFAATLVIASLIAACTPAASDNDPVAGSDSDAEATATAEPIATPADVPAETATRMESDADDACGASKVEPWIGQEATVPVRIEAAKASGAAADRWIYPDSVVTQDFRPDRLNVVMEKGTDRILSARCG